MDDDELESEYGSVEEEEFVSVLPSDRLRAGAFAAILFNTLGNVCNALRVGFMELADVFFRSLQNKVEREDFEREASRAIETITTEE